MRSLRLKRCVALGLLGLLCIVCVLQGHAYAAGRHHKELYADLGLSSEATKDEIKKAFRAFTRANHPDLKEGFDDKEAAKVAMAKGLRAYEVLSDEKKRADYDEMGIIPGEAPKVEEMTPDELFTYYHQSSPIFSKSRTLTNVTEVRRLQQFRGGRVFLVHIYDEVNCRNCRLYSTAWETLYQSSLVDAGVLEMYRIDALSDEGQALLTHLGVRFRAEPYVFAIVDGEVWTLYSIQDAMKQKNANRVFQHLLEFVMSFYYDVFQRTSSLEATQLEDILTYLRAPRPASQPLRALLPNLNAESIPVALQMRYDQVVVRSVPRDVLLEFVEEYCEMEVDVKDRFGEAVPMAEFIVVSAEALPTPPSDVTEDGDVAAIEAAEAAATPQKSCKLVHIGAAVALTYGKAAKFIESHLPERHVGMKAVQHAGATDFIDVCRGNCLVWVREDCGAAPPPHMVELMSTQYLSFKTGYWCMTEEKTLAAALTKAGAWTPTSQGLSASPSALVAMVGGNDSFVYPLIALSVTSVEDITAEDIYDALSSLVGGDSDAAEEAREGTAAAVKKTIEIRLPQSVASLLATAGFPLSYKQRLYIQAMTLYSFVSPILSNTTPFLLMFLVQKYVINRKKPEEKEEEERKRKEEQEAAAAAAATAGARGGAAAAATAPLRRRIRKPQPRVSPYNPRDMKWAKEEKGFLLFLAEDGSSAGSLPLPRLAMEDPFNVRVLGTGQNNWKEWMQAHKPPLPDGAKEERPEEEQHISVMAIRKTRMKAVVKSDGQTIDSFLRDLLDGTINPSEELPSWAYDE
ncbi:putative DNAJ domain protein [Leptomonas pyrrhocoris]|uniref:Putative DNAJ domain protein n=1 Tax=Leptomonas pyrrhocoris TaxID=157538 RepID=A0A0M9FZF2_LEPPY|nr:putative DNAJ domain protein [Leptomonas pyrrhocoris]KPA79059.1 putative DNAJ domain protein [Leptomonas pyrrhocoris]|eukprot:XP_015657498.1 putative DNAJ domain protein [Leptomonas pyrrhocoris]